MLRYGQRIAVRVLEPGDLVPRGRRPDAERILPGEAVVLELHAALYGVPRRVRDERIMRLLTLFELWDRRDSVVKQFSGGMRRKR